MRGGTKGRQKTKRISQSGEKKRCAVYRPAAEEPKGREEKVTGEGSLWTLTGIFRRKKRRRRVWPATGFNAVVVAVITLGAVPEPAMPVREVRWS